MVHFGLTFRKALPEPHARFAVPRLQSTETERDRNTGNLIRGRHTKDSIGATSRRTEAHLPDRSRIRHRVISIVGASGYFTDAG